MIPQHGAGFAKAAKKAGLKVGAKADGVFREWRGLSGCGGGDAFEIGPRRINVGAVQAVSEGKGCYGAVIFLAQSGIRQAAKATGIS